MRKSFAVGGGDVVEFDLVGTDVDGKPVEPILFRCLPKIQGKALTDSIVALRGRPDAESAGEIINFIVSALREEEEPRFLGIINGKQIIVELETLAEIMYYLMEAYGERPTEASNGSPLGQPSTTPTSPASAGATPSLIQENYPYPNSAAPSTP